MNKTQKFIGILYDILEVNIYIYKNPMYQRIIHWTRDGRAFIIEQKNEFSEKIMQGSFSTQNFQSFLRQLGVYGFRMRKNENNKKEYYHVWFTKGNQCSLYRIQRKRKDNGEINMANINTLNDNIKQQLIHLRTEQLNLLNQFQIQCQIQQMIAKKVHFIIDHFTKQQDARHREQFVKPMMLFFQLLPGYLPEIGDPWVETLKECCDPMTPIHDICNTPLFSLFK